MNWKDKKQVKEYKRIYYLVNRKKNLKRARDYKVAKEDFTAEYASRRRVPWTEAEMGMLRFISKFMTIADAAYFLHRTYYGVGRKANAMFVKFRKPTRYI